MLDWSRLESIVLAAGDGLVPGYRGIDLGSLVTLFPIVRLLSQMPAANRAALWRNATRPEGAKVAIAGGTLTIKASLQGSEYGYDKPVAHVVGLWIGSGGPLYGEGKLDPHGTLTP